MHPRPVSRRELLRRTLAGAGVASVLAVADAAEPSAALAAQTEVDGEVLRLVLAVEQLGLFIYEHVLDTRRLTDDAEPMVREILRHEHAHVRKLTQELTLLGLAAPEPPSSPALADTELAARHGSGSLTDLHSEADCLRLLLEAELVCQGAYYQAMSKLSDANRLKTTAQALAVEGQHYSVISMLLHPNDFEKAVPYAFVEGKS